MELAWGSFRDTQPRLPPGDLANRLARSAGLGLVWLLTRALMGFL